jgi:hypothetical protein
MFVRCAVYVAINFYATEQYIFMFIMLLKARIISLINQWSRLIEIITKNCHYSILSINSLMVFNIRGKTIKEKNKASHLKLIIFI